jgi:hypothetical protein
MFAPKAAMARTKATKNSTNGLAHQPTTMARHLTGRAPVELGPVAQRPIGNQAALRLLAQREPSPSGELPTSKPGDDFEREADRVAEQVMQMPEPQLRRACGCGRGCPKCQTEKLSPHDGLQPKQGGSRGVEQIAGPPIVNEVLSRPGQPLDATTRAFMEQRFRYDFSGVRVHTDELAGRSAEAIAAQAYTVGSQMVFARGRYSPASPDGQRLLAHELAHVAQQPPDGVIARQPDSSKSPKAPVAKKTVFHPGVMHNHQPSGRWADVQANPNSPGIIGDVCSHAAPENVMRAASIRALYDKPLARDHLHWFFSGGGADFVEDSNLELMLRTDAKVQAKILKAIPTGKSSGTFADHVTITQDNYDDDDLQYSFGEIDRLDFEVDFTAGTLHAWFQDRYEWHPIYPFYKKMDGDYLRDTNCVHAAAVELKSGTARDYWMKGEATIPLKAIQSTATRKDPFRDPPLPGL